MSWPKRIGRRKTFVKTLAEACIETYTIRLAILFWSCYNQNDLPFRAFLDFVAEFVHHCGGSQRNAVAI